MILKNIMIRVGKSLTKEELMPSAKCDVTQFDGFASMVDWFIKVAQEGIRPGMTELEAKTVLDEVRSMFGATYGKYSIDMNNEAWRMTGVAMALKNVDIGDRNEF